MISRKEKIMLGLTLSIGFLACLSLGELYKSVKADYQLYKNESACVADLIKRNISRNEIATGNGICWIKGTNQ